jgi:Pyridoxamine 5'-phosphate oxidase
MEHRRRHRGLTSSRLAFTRGLFAEDQWNVERVAEFVNARRNATVAAVSSAGQPHAAVVIAPSADDEIYFTVNPSSVLAGNLRDSDRIAVRVCDAKDAVKARVAPSGPARRWS